MIDSGMAVRLFELLYVLVNRIDLAFRERVSLVIRYYGFTLFHAIKRTTGQVTTHFDGYVLYCSSFSNLSSPIKDIFFLGEYRPSTVRTDQPFIIDCGANIGLTTLFLKRRFPRAKMIVFEPAEESYALLVKNITENRLTDVEAMRAAVSNAEGELEFWHHVQKSTSSKVAPQFGPDHAAKQPAEKYHVRRVPAVKLSSYISRKVDLLKIDIEGAEGLVFEDLHASGKMSQINEIIFEYHPDPEQHTNKLSRIVEILETNGFSIVPFGMSLTRATKSRPMWKPFLIRATRSLRV